MFFNKPFFLDFYLIKRTIIINYKNANFRHSFCLPDDTKTNTIGKTAKSPNDATKLIQNGLKVKITSDRKNQVCNIYIF